MNNLPGQFIGLPNNFSAEILSLNNFGDQRFCIAKVNITRENRL